MTTLNVRLLEDADRIHASARLESEMYLVDDEAIHVDGDAYRVFDGTSYVYAINRGILSTLPAAHAVGTTIVKPDTATIRTLTLAHRIKHRWPARLVAAIGPSDVEIVLDPAWPPPALGVFLLGDDDEYVRVTAVDGWTATLERGLGPTQARRHRARTALLPWLYQV
jgi:hypothetical protein